MAAATSNYNVEFDPLRMFSVTPKMRTRNRLRYTLCVNRLAIINDELIEMEEEMGIEHRWLPGSAEYREGAKVLVERRYRRAIDTLERLIVQRLFELSKLGMSGLGKSVAFLATTFADSKLKGCKLREKIGKALKTRAEAIRRALDEYNTQALLLNPPREQISWTNIVEAVFLAELDILKDTRQDVRALKWADPSHREAARLHFSMKCAREELARLNVEIRRSLTAMNDSHADYVQAIRANIVLDPPLAHELSCRWEREDRQNVHVAERLRDAATLKGFSGKFETGQRIGRAVNPVNRVPLPTWAAAVSNPPNSPPLDKDAQDEDEEGVVQLTDFMENLNTGVGEA